MARSAFAKGTPGVGRSLRLGSVHGIAIEVHPSFAIVLLWVGYQWGIAAHAGLAGMVFGLAVLLGVFGCVLLHELAHAVVALRYGQRVRDIVLLPIGGVARMEQSPLSPRAEAAIALAGPALNLLIVVALTPVVILLIAARHSASPLRELLVVDDLSVSGFVIYLWLANALLALFNLLPAFPMDGGRVLRATIARFRDRLVATRVAVGVGQLLAVVLAIVGVLLGDYLMPLVSAFIFVTAWIEARHVRVETSLRALEVGQFALWDGGGLRPDEPLAHAITGGPRDLAVTSDGVVVGMIWRREILGLLNGDHTGLLVRDLTDTGVIRVQASDSVYDVHLWLQTSGSSAVPVVDGVRYRGVFTAERLAHVYEYLGQRGGSAWPPLIQTMRRRLRGATRRIA